MSWLKVPSALEDTPRSSNASTSSDTRRTGQTDSSYTSSSGSYSYSDDSEEESSVGPRSSTNTPKVLIKQQSQSIPSMPSDSELPISEEQKSGSGDQATPRSAEADEVFTKLKKVKYKGVNEDEQKPKEKVYDNISQYYMAYHSNLMNAWYGSTLNMLINKQDYAVEAVKLEWLLKKRPKPNLKHLRKSKEEHLAMKEVEKELELLRQTSKEMNGEDKHEEEDEITNTLSDISDEIMSGKGKRVKREQKNNPKRDASRLHHLLNSHRRKAY